jgi:hypothetical protein
VPDGAIFAADLSSPPILFSKNVLGGTTASHTCLVWGAVIFDQEIGGVPQPTKRQRIGNQIDAAMILARSDFVNRGWNAQRSGGASAKWPCGFYFPGGRYLTVFFVAWSTSSGVISTVARDATAPLALTANESAAASTLLGRSAMITKSLPPKA